MRQQLITITAAAAVAAVAACGPGRTAAATQPTPAAFEPNKSDPQALGVVDKMIVAIGGAEAWRSVKQIQWRKKYAFEGKLGAIFTHAWDIWNGRHRFETVDMETYNASLSDPTVSPRSNVAMYDLFDRGKGAVFPGGNMQQKAPRSEADKFIKIAYENWLLDSYELAMIHKLQDPGVILSYAGEIKDMQGYCQPSCHEIKITFEPGVGTDTYYVDINSQSNLPEVVQKERGTGRVAFAIAEWAEAGGLKFPKKLQNLGAQGEVITLEDIRVGEPDDTLYVPQVF